MCDRKPIFSDIIWNYKFKKPNTVKQLTDVYVNPVKNGSLSNLNSWLTLTGHRFGHRWRRNIF